MSSLGDFYAWFNCYWCSDGYLLQVEVSLAFVMVLLQWFMSGILQGRREDYFKGGGVVLNGIF